MAYPQQVTREDIINQAWQLVDKNGLATLSLSKLAASLNIKAPSLYRYFRGKEALLQAVNLLTLQQLFTDLHQVIKEDDSPTDQMTAVLKAYRQFALKHPHTYRSIYQFNPPARPDEDTLVQFVLPIQEIMEKIAGPEKSLTGLRGALALAHGFVLLEIEQQLQRGGNLAMDFDDAVRAYLRGWL